CLLLMEAVTISAFGAVLGTMLGVGWARLLILLLSSDWAGTAVAVPLTLYLSPSSMLIGGFIGLVTGTMAAAWGLRALLRQEPGTLLIGSRTPSANTERRWRVPLVFAEALRFPGRSFLAIGLMAASAAILILVAAQRRGVSEVGRDGPTGGYAMRVTTALPIPENLASPTGRARLGCTPEEERVLADMQVAAFLVGPGEDISCRNPARPSQPRMLGCLSAMSGFGVTATAWESLSVGGDPIPVLGDADSLRWTLGIGSSGTARLMIRGSEREVRIVGAFPGSVFAGELVMGEAAFRRCFPSVTAPTYFLLQLPAEQTVAAATILRRRLAGFGVEVRATVDVVTAQLAVRDAYLSLFLALGSLGLLIGAGGLAVVFARSALERRAELALLAALGHRPSLILFAGHTLLLGLGLVVGLILAAGAVALGPPTHGAWMAACPAVVAVVLTAVLTAAVAARRCADQDLVQELRRE
ncbi:MAG: ABC transporter permease, partial [Planctomycetota bacterium]